LLRSRRSRLRAIIVVISMYASVHAAALHTQNPHNCHRRRIGKKISFYAHKKNSLFALLLRGALAF
jgi:hypothetical protein